MSFLKRPACFTDLLLFQWKMQMLILNIISELENGIDRKISQQCHCLSQPMDNQCWTGKSLFAIGIWFWVDLIHTPQSLTPTHWDHSHTCYMGRYMFLRHLDVKKGRFYPVRYHDLVPLNCLEADKKIQGIEFESVLKIPLNSSVTFCNIYVNQAPLVQSSTCGLLF